MFTPIDASGLRVSGGPYGGNSYQLLQVHLHWGCTDDVGSGANVIKLFMAIIYDLLHLASLSSLV